jgi:hypothetical protein
VLGIVLGSCVRIAQFGVEEITRMFQHLRFLPRDTAQSVYQPSSTTSTSSPASPPPTVTSKQPDSYLTGALDAGLYIFSR